MKRLNKKGFTLVELLVVIVILAVIMSIAIPSITSSIERRTSFTACKYSFSPGCFASSADKITSVFIVYNFFLIL